MGLVFASARKKMVAYATLGDVDKARDLIAADNVRRKKAKYKLRVKRAKARRAERRALKKAQSAGNTVKVLPASTRSISSSPHHDSHRRATASSRYEKPGDDGDSEGEESKEPAIATKKSDKDAARKQEEEKVLWRISDVRDKVRGFSAQFACPIAG